MEVASALGQRQMDCDTQFGIILMGTSTDHKLINMLQKILNHNKHLWLYSMSCQLMSIAGNQKCNVNCTLNRQVPDHSRQVLHRNCTLNSHCLICVHSLKHCGTYKSVHIFYGQCQCSRKTTDSLFKLLRSQKRLDWKLKPIFWFWEILRQNRILHRTSMFWLRHPICLISIPACQSGSMG